MMLYSQFKKIVDDCDIAYTENRTHMILKDCPNCNGQDKLWFDKNKMLWRCFKCEGLSYSTAKGNTYTFFRDVLEFDKFEIRRILKEHEIPEYVPEVLTVAEAAPLIEDKEVVVKSFDIPSNLIILDGSTDQIRNHKEVYQYLISRHVTDIKTIMKYKLRYNPAVKRLVFPVYNKEKLCVGLQTRDITNRHHQMHLKCQQYECSMFRTFHFFKTKEEISHCPVCNSELILSFYPKSSNSRDFPKTELFFGENLVDWTKPVKMVEGPFDVVNSDNAIGLLGRSLSFSQFWIIVNNLKAPLILDLDGDRAGSESTVDVYHKLCLFVDNMRINLREDGDDPGSHNIRTNSLLVDQAIHPHRWFLNKNILF